MRDTGYNEHVSIELNGLNRLLACSIKEKLCQESSLSDNCIFRVPSTLRRRNESSYAPNTVSIGPFHHDEDRFAQMEKMKLWYLDCLLARLPGSPEDALELFIDRIRKHASRARGFYAEKVNLSENMFVEMMVIDGCFLIELFRRHAWLELRENDPINTNWMLDNLYHDLVLLENQIPWFVLCHLFDLTFSIHDQESDSLIELVLKFFESVMLMTVLAEYKPREREIKHILDLLRSSLLSSNLDVQPADTNWELFSPVTDLLRAGVKFEKGLPDDILNIEFDNGVFKIPPIKIRGNSESLFRNLIAYEQCDRHCTDVFTSYAVFLDCLINTSKDADFLCEKGIINHALSTVDLSLLFNGLYHDTLVHDFYFGGLSREVNKYHRSRWSYHRSRWSIWIETLKRDYFGNPWSIFSFVAAILILVLTFIQTLFTILSY